MAEPLAPNTITERLADLPGWEGGPEGVRRTYKAPDFPTAIRIVDAVAEAAESMNHHPDIDIRWRSVHFAVVTHDAGAVTDADIELATRIAAIAAEHGAV